MSLLRAFVAIELPTGTQDAIQDQISRLKSSLGNDLVRWIPSKNIHLTLKFLGNITAAHVEFLKQMLAREADSHSEFDVQFQGLDTFPASKRPRILWIGLRAPSDLMSIQRNLETAAARLGFEKDTRAFSPHLTIARVRQNASPAELQKIRLGVESVQLGSIPPARVDSLHLLQSHLNPTGSVYTRLFSAKLVAKETAH